MTKCPCDEGLVDDGGADYGQVDDNPQDDTCVISKTDWDIQTRVGFEMECGPRPAIYSSARILRNPEDMSENHYGQAHRQ